MATNLPPLFSAKLAERLRGLAAQFQMKVLADYVITNGDYTVTIIALMDTGYDLSGVGLSFDDHGHFTCTFFDSYYPEGDPKRTVSVTGLEDNFGPNLAPLTSGDVEKAEQVLDWKVRKLKGFLLNDT